MVITSYVIEKKDKILIRGCELLMKANELTLDLLMEKDILNNYNMMINSIDSWGILRKDLIQTLGVERAKRFLIRYGWNDGKNEAEMFKKAFVWDDDLEWLIAGSKMHALAGRVISYPEKFQVDMRAGKFNVSGYWIDSHEAEQHLTHFSPHSEPICYYLRGYASGYTSECMGKTIIFKEESCKGKLDSYCSYVGKTLEEWGDEIEDELALFEEADLTDELDQMYHRLEQQRNILKIASTLNRRLTESLIEGEDLERIAYIFTDVTTRPIIIEDRNFALLAKRCDMPGLSDEFSAITLKDDLMQKADKQIPVIKVLPNKTFNLISLPIYVNEEHFGYVTTISYSNKEKVIMNALERMAEMTALWIKRERIAIEAEEKLSGRFLEELLSGKKEEQQSLYERFIRIGYDLTKPHYVMYIEIEQKDIESDLNTENATKDVAMIKNSLVNYFNQDKKEFNQNYILFSMKANILQVIISKELLELKQMTIKHYTEGIFRLVPNQTHNIYVGVSDVTATIHDFSDVMNESKKAVELAKFQQKESTITYTSELGHMSLLLNARNPEQLNQYALDKLYPLIEYDENYDSSLLYTLYSYSQNEFNLHKTARNIHISISGMRYRIQKIEELLGKELTDSNFRFEIQLALYTLYTLGKIKSK